MYFLVNLLNFKVLEQTLSPGFC